ncbi:MAG: OadG family protein [Clostridia bacterium]|nr:OadG family protein [Clostridia bacterium]
MYLLNADISILADAGSVIAIGLMVVFLVLLLLTAVFKIFGIAMSGTQEEQENTPPVARAAAPVAPTAPAAPMVGNTETVSSKPDVDGGVPAETVAVISAAVASVAPAGTQYAVKSIHKL